jgi:hypothetical protein
VGGTASAGTPAALQMGVSSSLFLIIATNFLYQKVGEYTNSFAVYCTYLSVDAKSQNALSSLQWAITLTCFSEFFSTEIHFNASI